MVSPCGYISLIISDVEHLRIFFGEMSIQVPCLIFNWLVLSSLLLRCIFTFLTQLVTYVMWIFRTYHTAPYPRGPSQYKFRLGNPNSMRGLLLQMVPSLSVLHIPSPSLHLRPLTPFSCKGLLKETASWGVESEGCAMAFMGPWHSSLCGLLPPLEKVDIKNCIL